MQATHKESPHWRMTNAGYLVNRRARESARIERACALGRSDALSGTPAARECQSVRALSDDAREERSERSLCRRSISSRKASVSLGRLGKEEGLEKSRTTAVPSLGGRVWNSRPVVSREASSVGYPSVGTSMPASEKRQVRGGV